MPKNNDIYHMKLAILQARLSQPEDDRPRPYVGVVVVREGEILATAFRGEKSPGDHAEFGVLEKKLASAKVAGCTVYTTLEPCTTRNHPKIPCADRLVERRVKRVVIGALDPDQRITGQGVLRLRRAGIAVDLFPPDLMEEIEELNREFFRDRATLATSSPLPPEKILRDLANWLLNNPIDDPLIHGIALREAGHINRAIECLEEAARRTPNFPRYYSNAAYAYEKKGNFDRAIEKLLTALEIRRNNDGLEWPRYHYHLARYYLARGLAEDIANAKNHLASAVAIGPIWEQTAIRDASVFTSILDDALLEARERHKAEMKAREDTLTQIKHEVSVLPHVVHAAIYGSYWLNGATRFRDIDVCVVTNGPETNAEFSTRTAHAYDGAPINIYIVPRAILLADIESATHGQYFSHKFILGAEGILNEPEVEACILLVMKHAIRDAVVWHYRHFREEVFTYRYSSNWFLAMVLKHRLTRDKSFCRCLKRLFDHHSDEGLSRLKKAYENALRELRLEGDLAEGPGREGLWLLDHEKVLAWEKVEGVTDGQVADRFWQTYGVFKGPNGNEAIRRKKALLDTIPLPTMHEIENQIEKFIGKGRFER